MECLRSKTVRFSAIGLIALFAVLAIPASAAPVCSTALAPSSFVLPSDCTGDPLGTLLASNSAAFTSSLGTDSGTLRSAVYMNGGGTLDFYYQVVLNTTSTNCGGGGQPACDPIGRETNTDFGNWGTSVATRTDAFAIFTAGTILPQTADRNGGPGNVVAFSFTPPETAKITPGTTSVVLAIYTNATSYTLGNSSVIDGGTTTVQSFEPNAVPEPATLALFGLGLLAVAGVRRFRTR